MNPPITTPTDLLERASNWLEDQRKRHTSRPVVYQRGAVSSAPIDATVGRTVFEQADEYGVVQKTESRDFLMFTTDLVLNGDLTLPQRGDRVLEEQGSKTFTYEVVAPGGEPVFRYSDPYRKSLRIHTKHTATQEPL
jgi:hypothetical protein